MTRDLKTYNRAYHEAHREEMKAAAKLYYEAHKEQAKANMRAFATRNPLAQRGYVYRMKRGEIAAMLEACGSRCAICGVTFDPFRATGRPGTSKRAMTVDHDHNTGKVRGLLCSSCNNVLARANDDPRILVEAVRYLAEHVDGTS